MMKQSRLWRWLGLGAFVCALTMSSCSCEDRIRRWISNQDQTRTSFEPVDAGDEASGPAEQEPNDDQASAHPIDLTAREGPLSGEIEPSSDVDWYLLEPAEGDSWIVELVVTPPEDSELDPAIEVAAKPEGSTRFDVAEAGEPESVPRLLVPKDGRLVAIRAAGDAGGKYELTTQRRMSGAALESEPNETRKTAVGFPFPGGIQGYYDRPGDVDWLQSESSEIPPGIYSVSLAPIPEMTHRADFFTGSGSEDPWTTLKAGPERSAEIPNLGVPGGLSSLWVRLQAEGDRYNREAPYRIRFVEHAEPDGFVLESEPNDSDATSQSIRLGDEVRGYFHHTGDTDRFSLLVGRAAQKAASDQPSKDAGTPTPKQASADAGSDESSPSAPPKKMEEDDSLVDMPPKMGDLQDAGAGRADQRPGSGSGKESPDSIDSYLEPKESPEHLAQVALKPLNDDATVQMTWLNPRDGGRRALMSDDREEPAILCNVPIDDGSIELVVSKSSRKGDSQRRDYRTSFAYAVAVADVVGQVDNIEVEPNDSRQSADPLRPGTGRSGYIAYGDDTDVFGFLVPERGETSERAGAESEFDAGSITQDTVNRRPEPRSTTVKLRANRLDLGLELVDSQGALVAEIDKAGAGANESATLDLPPGVYFVKVSSAGGQECRPYELDIDVAGR
jgi:hypothetical protein